jgi:hypothetical protein
VNQTLKRNFIEGRTWTYQTLAEISAHFAYYTEKQVRTIIDNLVKKKVLKKGNFNKTKMDKTCWYSFVDEDLYSKNVYESPNGQIDCPNGQMEMPKRAEQYQILNTDAKPSSSSQSPSSSSRQEPILPEEEEPPTSVLSYPSTLLSSTEQRLFFSVSFSLLAS